MVLRHVALNAEELRRVETNEAGFAGCKNIDVDEWWNTNDPREVVYKNYTHKR